MKLLLIKKRNNKYKKLYKKISIQNKQFYFKNFILKILIMFLLFYFNINFKFKNHLKIRRFKDKLKYKQNNKINNFSFNFTNESKKIKFQSKINITNKFVNNSFNKINNKYINNYSHNKYHFNSLLQVINKLNNDVIYREPKYIILIDYYSNSFCEDINSYLIFEYYLNHNITDAYYVINDQSDLYKSLLRKNQTKNLITIHGLEFIYNVIYPYLLHSKIIINSYISLDIQEVVSKVNYLKYLFITHAIGFFKTKIIANQFDNLIEKKRNIIISSPYEYNKYKNNYKYNDSYMYKAGLPRYDLLQSFERNNSEKKCILINFTYRKYNNDIYNISLFKKNLEKLLNDNNLISFLNNKSIDLIYIKHHYDVLRRKPFNPKLLHYAKYRNQSLLSHYIKQCSLLITDFSTICFDFMFLNKPVLFYLIDLNDTINFEEKEYMNYNKIYNISLGNVFLDQISLIKKIEYYVNKSFEIDNKLIQKYNSIFYYKNNITEKIINIINIIIKKNKIY